MCDQAHLADLEEVKVDLFRGYPVAQKSVYAESQFKLNQQKTSGQNLMGKYHYFKSTHFGSFLEEIGIRLILLEF